MIPKPNHALTEAYRAAEVPLSQRDSLTALGVGRVVGYSLPLPPEKQGDKETYFEEMCLPIAKEAISNYNEASVLDFDYALKVAHLFWCVRYDILFDPHSQAALCAATAMVKEKLGADPACESMDELNPGGRLESVHASIESYLIETGAEIQSIKASQTASEGGE